MLLNLAAPTAPALSIHHRVPSVRSWQHSSGKSDSQTICAKPRRLHFERDQPIYGEGDDAMFAFKIDSGVVRTCRFSSDGRRQIDGFYIAGDMFGLDVGDSYKLSAEAVTDCTLHAYRRRSIEEHAHVDAASQQSLTFAMDEMNRTKDHLLLLRRRGALEKVTAFLTQWASRSPASSIITLPMSRQDIADYLDLTIETVSRTLSRLEREAIISLPTARQIIVRNPGALRGLCN